MRFGGEIARAMFFYVCVLLGLGWSAEDLASDKGASSIFAAAMTAAGLGITAALSWKARSSAVRASAVKDGSGAAHPVQPADRERVSPFRWADSN